MADRGPLRPHQGHAVKRGTVVVRDFAKRKNKTVKKGHSYVARG